MDLFDLDEYFSQQGEGLSNVQCASLIMGAKTDLLFPIWQQKELAEQLSHFGDFSLHCELLH